jgi:hypothetical protein
LKDDVPDIESASRFGTQQYYILNVGNKSLKPKGAIVDATFLKNTIRVIPLNSKFFPQI